MKIRFKYVTMEMHCHVDTEYRLHECQMQHYTLKCKRIYQLQWIFNSVALASNRKATIDYSSCINLTTAPALLCIPQNLKVTCLHASLWRVFLLWRIWRDSLCDTFRDELSVTLLWRVSLTWRVLLMGRVSLLWRLFLLWRIWLGVLYRAYPWMRLIL